MIGLLTLLLVGINLSSGQTYVDDFFDDRRTLWKAPGLSFGTGLKPRLPLYNDDRYYHGPYSHTHQQWWKHDDYDDNFHGFSHVYKNDFSRLPALSPTSSSIIPLPPMHGGGRIEYKRDWNMDDGYDRYGGGFRVDDKYDDYNDNIFNPHRSQYHWQNLYDDYNDDFKYDWYKGLHKHDDHDDSSRWHWSNKHQNDHNDDRLYPQKYPYDWHNPYDDNDDDLKYGPYKGVYKHHDRDDFPLWRSSSKYHKFDDFDDDAFNPYKKYNDDYYDNDDYLTKQRSLGYFNKYDDFDDHDDLHLSRGPYSKPYKYDDFDDDDYFSHTRSSKNTLKKVNNNVGIHKWDDKYDDVDDGHYFKKLTSPYKLYNKYDDFDDDYRFKRPVSNVRNKLTTSANFASSLNTKLAYDDDNGDDDYWKTKYGFYNN